MSQSTSFKMKVVLLSRHVANAANSAVTPPNSSRSGIDPAASEANAEPHRPLRRGQGGQILAAARLGCHKPVLNFLGCFFFFSPRRLKISRSWSSRKMARGTRALSLSRIPLQPEPFSSCPADSLTQATPPGPRQEQPWANRIKECK